MTLSILNRTASLKKDLYDPNVNSAEVEKPHSLSCLINNISKMFPAVLFEKVLKNVLPQNRDVNQTVGLRNQWNQSRREGVSSQVKVME